MNNTLKFVKKGVSIAVTSTTILWSVGIGTLAPLATHAAQPGQLIKGPTSSTVYYLGSDSKRYVFPNPTTYFSWYSDFSGVVTVSQSELESYSLGGNVTIRPGTKLVKITTDPKTYAVEPGGQLRHITSEAIATTLYGANVWGMVVDVPDYFFTNYKASTSPISTNTYPTGTLVKSATGTDIYYVDGSAKRMVTSAGLSGNMLQMANVVTAPDSVFNALTAGTNIAAQESTIWNVQGGATTGPVSTGTGLTVALASDTPASTVYAGGTAYNPALKVNLTASADGSVNVTGLTLTRMGVSTDSQIAGVAIFDQNGKRHGNFLSFSESKAALTFSSDPIIVPAGQTIGAMVKVNLPVNAALSGTVAIAVSSSADVKTTASVTGSFPVVANGFSMIPGTGSVGSLTVDAVTVHSNGQTDGTAVNINLGTVDQEITRFRLAAGAAEDILVKSLTLYNNGNANDGDLTNIDLVAPDGTILGTVTQTTNRYAVFTLATAYNIAKGTSRDLTVRADVVGGSTRTARFVLSNDYDLEIAGKDTGSGILPTAIVAGAVDSAFPIGDANGGSNSCPADAGDQCINKITVAEGTLLFAKANDSTSGNVSAGGTSIVFGKWEATAQGEDMELRTITWVPTYTTTFAGTLKFQVGGATVYSVAAASIPATTVADTNRALSSYPVLKTGVKTSITIVGDISSTATSGTTASFSLDLTQAKKLSTNVITDPSVAATAANTLTVSTAALSVAKNSSFSNTTVVAGQSEAKVGSYNITASSTEDIAVSSITVGLTNTTGVSNLMLKSGSTQLGSTTNTPAASNVISISNFSIPKGSTVTVDVYLTTNSSATTTEVSSITAVSATGKNSSVSVTASGLTATGQTIQFSTGGTLSIARDSTNTAVAQILHSGLVDQNLLAVRLSANNAEDIKVTNVQVTATSGATTLKDLKLYSGSTQIGTTTQLNGGVASFSGLTLIVSKDQTITVYVKGSTTTSSTIDSLAVVNLAVDYIEGLGVSGGSTIKPGTTLATTWTGTTAAVTTANLTVGSTAGFHRGDVLLVQSNVNGGSGSLGVVLSEPTLTTTLTAAVMTAVTTNAAGTVTKIGSGTWTVSDNSDAVTLAGTDTTVTSTKGFAVGDSVILSTGTDVALGVVSAISSSTQMTIKAIEAIGGNVDIVAKIGTDTVMTTATSTGTSATTYTAGTVGYTVAPLGTTVASTTGFSAGDMVILQNTTVAGSFGMVTAVASSTTMTVSANAASDFDADNDGTLDGTTVIARVGSANPSTTLSTTLATGIIDDDGVAVTATSTSGFGASDVVLAYNATDGVTLGRVSTLTSAIALTVIGAADTITTNVRLTRLPGAAAASNGMTIHDVEPTITANSSVTGGSSTGQSTQSVAAFDVKADGDRNMDVTALSVLISGSNQPYINVANYDLYNGATKLATSTVLSQAATVAGAQVLTGTSILLCSAVPNAAGEINLGSTANVTAAANKILVGDTIILYVSATQYISAKVTAKATGAVCNTTPDATDVTLTVSGSSTVGTAPTSSTAALTLKSYNVVFDSNSSTPLATQTITAGSTLTLTVKADTTNVRAGLAAGTTASYNVKVDGTQGSTGSLFWSYTPSGGTAVATQSVSDSYSVSGPTFTY
ncbi:hypothetical protein A3E96_04695 [Candidatus Uhrbacteria bacterium RIFCSPHIGHO2_12_FULL_46_13]|uniref:Uncharacterized protein n=1 Tax=Candidatus Uhrbacteria bacterium RIFCSPLOWO2_01_FULL_47_25 TaxID=1802402 RepID=A0A1F7UTI7_9BACT|nr:MAG: hemagluttinin family protein [Parcubacteria group bacterium GW2011_GWA2_46_9]OGL60625.1 MAG: hypothetical protein A2752_02245 [Candidatus Uhrbacteria bacterium RIFCSPHIGHO2_01_FULL_46_23]OGL68136.1 MAG: hypothetical protein A3D60_03990 [Candidatus Uhrbacteria bacterium RIFCSPHIGHO2_02_FULL_47_29]OGL74818.1 MAG: hypothetical protein A3E96_04695 [Candidatus Uhrbacteria bacterium RIFCSPHIGHO2_12_FULL_46_13]OGL80987.1 MAG: hypothetical protein A2936_03325 [Candidatus Uhrbacteria bacterium R